MPFTKTGSWIEKLKRSYQSYLHMITVFTTQGLITGSYDNFFLHFTDFILNHCFFNSANERLAHRRISGLLKLSVRHDNMVPRSLREALNLTLIVPRCLRL